MQFTYEQGGVRTWVIDDDYDNHNRTFTLVETRPDGSTQVYTWDDATQRLNGGGGFYFKRPAGSTQAFPQAIETHWTPQLFEVAVQPVGDYFSILTDQQLATKTWYDRYTQSNIMGDASPIAYDQFPPFRSITY